MFYVFTVFYISVCRTKMIIVLFWKTKTGNLLFPCLCFYLWINDTPCLIRYLSISFTLAISRSSAAQKIGVSHRLHPFPISLYKALYGVLTAENGYSIPSSWILTFCLLRQNCTLFLHIIFPLFISCAIALILGCKRDKKIGAVSGLHLILIAEIYTISQRRTTNIYSPLFSNTFW